MAEELDDLLQELTLDRGSAATETQANDNVKPLDTPKITRESTVIEKKLMDVINRLRDNPTTFKKLLDSKLGNFKGNIYSVKEGNTVYNTETHEGAAAVKEALSFLDKQMPCLPLKWVNGLNHASEEVRAHLGDSGSTQTEGGDKLNAIILKYGTYDGTLNKLVCFGDQDADEIVATWLVGDGDKNRTARHNLFNKAFKYAGAALGSHKSEFKYCGVVHFVSGEWKNK